MPCTGDPTATLTAALQAFAANHLADCRDHLDDGGGLTITATGDLPGPTWDPADEFAVVWLDDAGNLTGWTTPDTTVTIDHEADA